MCQSREKLKGGPVSLSRYCMLGRKRVKTFLVQSTRIGTLKGKTFSDFSTFLSQNTTKLKGDPLKSLKIFRKSLRMPKKQRGALWDFSTSILSQNVKKIGRGPFVKKIEKSSTMSKKTGSGDPLVSPGIVCYAENRKNRFGLVLLAK